MGLALLRARLLDADARQLAIWDGKPAFGDAGTAIDIETWRDSGWPTTVIAPRTSVERASSTAGAHAQRPSARVVRAMLFADIQGSSRLTDEELPRFADRVLGAFADVLAHHGG